MDESNRIENMEGETLPLSLDVQKASTLYLALSHVLPIWKQHKEAFEQFMKDPELEGDKREAVNTQLELYKSMLADLPELEREVSLIILELGKEEEKESNIITELTPNQLKAIHAKKGL